MSKNNPFGSGGVQNPDAVQGTHGALPPQNPQFHDEEFSVDLSDPTVTGMIPAGEYAARLVALETSYSQAGNKMWVWDFALLNSPIDTGTMRLWTALTPAAMWKVIETLTALGLGSAGEPAKFNKSDALNRLCRVVVKFDQGRMSIDKALPWLEGIGAKWAPGMMFSSPVVAAGNQPVGNISNPFAGEPVEAPDNPFGNP